MGMSPEIQIAFDVLLALVAFFGGTVINDQRRELQEQRKMHKEHAEKFSQLPMSYVLRDDYRDFQKAIFSKLDRIENKLDGKEDKVGG